VYAAKLLELYGDVAAAKAYVEAHGSFSFHQTGLIGVLSGQHTDLMRQLNESFGKLLAVTQASSGALADAADSYEHTDDDAAARIDAAYPAAPRPQTFRD
jgi:hypothetical protein